MTIAAGFKVRNGILLCADTEHSGHIKIYKEKILRHHFKTGSIAFALAGNVTYAGMAVRDCMNHLAAVDAVVPRDIETAFRNAIHGVYQKYGSNKKENIDFDIIAAITFPSGWEPYMLSTNHQGVDEVHDFVGHGTGWNLMDYIVRRAYDPMKLSLDQAVILGLQFLSATKNHVEGVGGPSQFVFLNDGAMTDVMTRDFGVAEEQIQKYEQASAALLLSVGTSLRDESAFRVAVEAYIKEVDSIRTEWKKDASWLANMLQRFTPAAPPNPQPTTNAP